MPILLLNNWKLILGAIVIGASFYAGFHLRTLQYEASEKGALESRVEAMGASVTHIIDFNAEFDKEKLLAKDSCIDALHPAYLGRVLK